MLPFLLFLENKNFDEFGVDKMDFFELMYYGAVLGMGCYLGAMGMKAAINLLEAIISWINKKLSKFLKGNNQNKK